MNGKLTLETTKKLLLTNIPLVLIYLIFQTAANFAGNELIKFPIYAESALQLITLVLGALCIAAIVISLLKTFLDLFSEKSYKYYSLPYKKSEIIMSKAIPAIIIESLMVVILLDPADIQYLIQISFEKTQNSAIPGGWLTDEWISRLLNSSARTLMIVVTIGFLILLAFIISRSFDPSKKIINLLLAIIVEALVNVILYIAIVNVSSGYSLKYESAVQKAVMAAPILTAKELYASIGLLAYYNEILSAVIISIMIIEIICLIIASKKLADKKLNVV